MGPVAAPVIQEYGVLGMALLKFGAFGTCYLMYSVVPSPYDLGVPLGLSALGGVVSVWNTVVIAVMLA